MRYFNREEIENIGRAGSYWDIEKSYCKARVLGSFWMYLDPADLGFTPHMTTHREGFWESWITKWMSENVAPGSKCIDVGANMGYYSMFLAQHGCKVIAVEPQKNLAELIQMSADENRFDIRVDECAISDKGGEMKMHVPVGHGMNASLAYEPLSPNGYYESTVEVNTLDTYAAIGAHYDFIKVDVEGAEDKVLRGAKKFIKQNPDCLWLVEWRWDRLSDPEASAKEIFDTFSVGHVDFNGNEVSLARPEDLASQKNDDWMLVLRRKK